MILERISIFLLFILPVVLTCPNRGCLCPSTGSNLLVPELLHPQQNKIERLVVYLYNVDGVLKLYIPHQNKQKLIPDLELSEEDHLQTVTIETIREIFSVSLNTITVYTKERRIEGIRKPIHKIGPNHYENPVIVLPNINNIIDRYPIQPSFIQEIIQNVYPKPNSKIQYNDLYENIDIEYDIDPESYLYNQPVDIPNYIDTYDLDPSTIIISDPYDINTNPIIREIINVPQDVNQWTPATQPIIESIYLQPNYQPIGPSFIEIDPNVEIRPQNDPSAISNINELLIPANLNNEGKIKVITQPYQVISPEVETESNPYQIIRDPGSNEIVYNLDPSIVESNELILPPTDINNYIPLTKWLITEMNMLKNKNLNVAYDLIAIGHHIKDILVNNGLQINDNGILTDVKGNVLNVHYLNLRPIIVGPSKSYEGEIDVNHPLYTTVNYLQALLVTRTNPPGLLGVIPLSDSINPNKSLKPGVGELINNLKKIPLLNHDTILYHSHPGKLDLGDALKPQLDILNIDSNVDSDSNAEPIESNVHHQNSPINLAYNKHNLGLLPADVIEDIWNEPLASTLTSNIDLSHHTKPNYNEGNLLNYHNSQPYIQISDPQRLSSNNLLLELLHEQQNTNPIVNPLNPGESKLNYPWYNIPGSLNIPSQQVLSNPLHLINGGYDIGNLGQLNQYPQNYISRPGKNTHITNQDDIKQYIDMNSAENQMKHRQISYPNYNAIQNQIDYGYSSSGYGILDLNQLHPNQDSIAISGQNLPINIYGDNQRYLDLNSGESQILLQPHITNQYTNLRPYQISPNYDLDVINPFLPDGYSQHQEPSSLQNDLNSIYLNLENENNHHYNILNSGYQPNAIELDEDGSGQYTPLNLLGQNQNKYILNSVQHHPQLDVNNLDSNILDVLNHQQNNNLLNILQNQEALNLNAIQQSNDINNINLNKVDQNIYNNILDLTKNQPSGDLNTIQSMYNNLNSQELQLVQPTTFSLASNGHDLKIEGRPKYFNQNVKNDIVVDGTKLNISSSSNLEILGRSADSLTQSNNQNGELINTINDQNLEQSVYENVDDNESLVDPIVLEHDDEIIGITKDTRTKAPDLLSQENAYLSPLAEEEVLQLPSKNIITRQPRDFSDILMQGEGGDDGLVYRIIGGNAATGSGTPVSNKGRSGYYG